MKATVTQTLAAASSTAWAMRVKAGPPSTRGRTTLPALTGKAPPAAGGMWATASGITAAR